MFGKSDHAKQVSHGLWQMYHTRNLFDQWRIKPVVKVPHLALFQHIHGQSPFSPGFPHENGHVFQRHPWVARTTVEGEPFQQEAPSRLNSSRVRSPMPWFFLPGVAGRYPPWGYATPKSMVMENPNSKWMMWGYRDRKEPDPKSCPTQDSSVAESLSSRTFF